MMTARIWLVSVAICVGTVATVDGQTVGRFSPTGAMGATRQSHTETLLPDGTVLITGGDSEAGPLRSAERYDPALGTFSPTGSMTNARSGQTATLLANGTVLIAGGTGTDWSSAEIYDPSTGIFSPTGSMVVSRLIGQFPLQFRVVGRYQHTATRLADGRVLFAGGFPGPALDAEIYDPATGTFAAVGGNCIAMSDGSFECGMTARRSSHTATLLNDGSVLVLGGSGTAAAETFNPAIGEFRATSDMTMPRYGHTATRLSNGNVVVAGGQNGGYLATAEVYDWVAHAFSAIPPMKNARSWHSATLLATGHVLLAGGFGDNRYLADAETFDAVSGSFSTTGATMTTPRAGHTATLLTNGNVLVTGGNSGGSPPVVNSADLFEPGPSADDGALVAIEDTMASGTLVATAPTGSSLTFQIVSNGLHGTATVTDASTGAFTYTPNPNENGSDTFTFKVTSDGVDSNVATIAVTIDPRNDAPVATDASLTTKENTEFVGLLDATDIDSAALTFSIVDNGAKGTATITNAATGAFTYTPNANANGPDTFTFKANDGALDSNVATVSVTITAVNDAPVATNGALTTPEDTAGAGTLNATDIDSGVLTFSIVANGTKGTATITNAATGAFTYTPNANANGPDTFTFKANDGALDSNMATVSVTITAVNDAPVATNGTLTTAEDTAAAGTLHATDIDSGVLTFSIVTNGAKGTATITNAATGAYTYTPTASAHGPDTFTFKANDGVFDSNVATVTVTITSVNNRAPVASNDGYNANLNTVLAVSSPGVLGNDTDANGDVLTAVLATGPAHGTLLLSASGAFTYTPATNYSGPDSFVYMANDGSANSNVATVSLTVMAPSVTLSPGSLMFAQQAVGTTSATQVVSLRNTGNGVLAVSGISINGGNREDFALSETCGPSVLPGTSCTINVVFQPSAVGQRSSTVQVATNAVGGLRIVQLRGVGVAPPIVSWSPTSLTFGNQLLGTTSAAQRITLTNTGGNDLLINNISIGGPNASDFRYSALGACQGPGKVLPAGRSCRIDITFAPLGVWGGRHAYVEVTDNAAGSPHRIDLTGTGINMPFTLTPDTVVDFGVAAIPTSRSAVVTVHNVSTSDLTLTADAGPRDPIFHWFEFTASTTACQRLRAGQSCSITVVWHARSTGGRFGTLTVTAGVANYNIDTSYVSTVRLKALGN